MRKIFVLVFFFGLIFGNNYLNTKTASKYTLSPVNIEVQAEKQKPETPQAIIIPKIGLASKIHKMGLNEEKIVATPDFEVGWYEKSAKPGETGTAAFNGHFLNSDLTPGIFNRLSELSPGDEIQTVDSIGSVYKYKVTEKKHVDLKNFPLEEVYGNHGSSILSLVTCAGNFNEYSRDYDQRTIVFAELIDE